jgi:uncharacterized protein (TIGR02001 family)
MKKMTKSLLAVAVLAATSTAAMAEVTMNAGVTSNYIWRGVTQSSDEAAVSGGIDYAHESGVYVGTWASSLGGNETELDLYAGYGTEFSGVGLDVGYIQYNYINSDTDFAEVYVGASYDMFSAMVSYDSDAEDMYIEVGADIALPQDFTLGLHYGSYDFDDDAASTDYSDYSISVSKGDVTFAYTDTDENAAWGMSDNARFSVSYGVSF